MLDRYPLLRTLGQLAASVWRQACQMALAYRHVLPIRQVLF
nr:MAG TPA: hypothetical protein [Caudoviricetes sp.]